MANWRPLPELIGELEKLYSGLVYRASNDSQLTCFADADWAGDKVNRKSTSGVMLQLSGAAILYDAQEKAMKIVKKTKEGMHYKQLAKPTPRIDYITPDCDRTAENPHAAASPFRAMRPSRSVEGGAKPLAIAPRQPRLEQID